jgi:hypothetical protein
LWVGLVNLGGLGFFFLNFLMIFFSISSFCIKLFELELCHFFASLIVLLFREQVGQVNPGQFAFYFSMFFLYLTVVFYVRSFFRNSIFFIMISCREWWVSRVNLGWLRFVFP